VIVEKVGEMWKGKTWMKRDDNDDEREGVRLAVGARDGVDEGTARAARREGCARSNLAGAVDGLEWGRNSSSTRALANQAPKHHMTSCLLTATSAGNSNWIAASVTRHPRIYLASFTVKTSPTAIQTTATRLHAQVKISELLESQLGLTTLELNFNFNSNSIIVTNAVKTLASSQMTIPRLFFRAFLYFFPKKQARSSIYSIMP
jgi:hypothetical protein